MLSGVLRRGSMWSGCAAAVVAACGGAAAFGEVDIKSVAPASSVVVVGVDDFASAQRSFENAGFAAIWNDPQVQRWVGGLMEDQMGEMDEMLEKFGFSRDDFSTPSGAAGFALFIDQDEVDPMASEYHFVAMADFGENAERMHEFIEAALDQGVEEGDVMYAVDDYRETAVWTISEAEGGDADDEGMEDEWGEGWDDMGEGGGGEVWEEVHYTRSGGVLMMSSSMSALEVGLDRMMGDEGASIADSASFNETVGALGGVPQVYAVATVGPWLELAESIDDAMRMGGGGGMPPVMQILEASGLSEVRGFGLGVNFDTAEAAVEQRIAVMVPERRGLMGLIPGRDASFTAPDFVPANASGLSMVQVSFGELLPTVQEIISGLPAEFRNQAMGVTMMGGMASPILNNIGPEVYMVSSIERPFSAESQKSVVAIASQDSDRLRESVGQLVQQFGLPLNRREFEGATIFEMPEEMMGGMGGMGGPMGGAGMPAIGIGAGYMFVGEPSGIETMLRTAGNADASRLKDEPRFQRALAGMRDSGLSFSWSDLRDSLEYLQWSLENREKIMREQLRDQFGEGPEADRQIEEMMQWMGDDGPGFLENLPEASVVFDRLGDTVGEMRATPRGIIGVYKTLRAE